MYKEVLQSITGIAIYPLISFVIFFVFFLLVLLLVFRSDKGFISKMENLPLNDSTNNALNNYEKTI